MPTIPKNKDRVDAFILKIIAIDAMLLNHIGYMFLVPIAEQTGYAMSVATVCLFLTELIGKLTFPIMAFLLLQGYRYTRNFWKYALRLFLFALISLLPYHWFDMRSFTMEHIYPLNNVLFTLFLGLIMVYICDHLFGIKSDMPLWKKICFQLMQLVFVFATCYLAQRSDWYYIGILMIYGFYRIQNPTAKVVVTLSLLAIVDVWMRISIAQITQITQHYFTALSMLGILLCIPLLLRYNGKRGINTWWSKWSFYIFYPTHLLILTAIYVCFF